MHHVDVSHLSVWMRPPMCGGAWMDPLDSDVGTAHYCSSYMWNFDIWLQVRVANGRITEARCTVSDDTSESQDLALASAICEGIIGRTIAGAVNFKDTLFWSPDIAAKGIYRALAHWARYKPEREALLPPDPEPPRKRTVFDVIGDVRRAITGYGH